MSEKPKLCPFCKGKASKVKTYIPQTGFMACHVGCYSQKCKINPCAVFQNSELPHVGWGKSESFMRRELYKAAIKAWNRRPK